MGKHRKLKKKEKLVPESASVMAEPKLAKRSANRKSTIMSGRTIGEKRERLETKNERAAARKKDKKRAARRVFFTLVGFVALGAVLVFLCLTFINTGDDEPVIEIMTEPVPELKPTIEIIDEDASAAEGKITGRMTTYIGQFERDIKDLGYKPVKAVIPSGSIREVDFYLEDYTGYIKTTIDRDSAVSAEDADRLLRYLKGNDVSEFQYIDVRLQGRAFWK